MFLGSFQEILDLINGLFVIENEAITLTLRIYKFGVIGAKKRGKHLAGY